MEVGLGLDAPLGPDAHVPPRLDVLSGGYGRSVMFSGCLARLGVEAAGALFGSWGEEFAEMARKTVVCHENAVACWDLEAAMEEREEVVEMVAGRLRVFDAEAVRVGIRLGGRGGGRGSGGGGARARAERYVDELLAWAGVGSWGFAP